jgi:hypothetical protein
MRITEQEHSTIKQLSIKFFGERVRIWLFGSRADDSKKGGDIDLYLQSDEPSSLLFDKKINFLVELKQLIGDQQIDLVVHSTRDSMKQTIHYLAEETGILL